MAFALQQYHQLADRMATQITGSYQSWTDFLTTAARLYKYPYHEQLERATRHPKHKAQKQPTKPIDPAIMDQDDRFFYIAGHTSGGVPYGVTWEEMGLDPWAELE